MDEMDDRKHAQRSAGIRPFVRPNELDSLNTERDAGTSGALRPFVIPRKAGIDVAGSGPATITAPEALPASNAAESWGGYSLETPAVTADEPEMSLAEMKETEPWVLERVDGVLSPLESVSHIGAATRNSLADVLERIADRVRRGDVHVDVDGALASLDDEAALAAVLAALRESHS